MKRFSLLFCLIFAFFALQTAILAAQEAELLTRGEIQKVMQKIFDQHVEKKRITKQIIQNSFKVYIEQFDPDGLYLLESEVEPYFNMAPAFAEAIEKQYLSGNFTAYEELNNLIQKSISRSRAIRSGFEKSGKELLREALSGVSEAKSSGYPAQEAELKQRIKNNLIAYLQAEVRRYGEKGVSGYEPQAIALYERNVRSFEDQYTFRNDKGELFEKPIQENLFTLHILKSLAKSLDAHTAFFNSEEAYDMKVRLEKGFDGIGIVFQEAPMGIVVSHLVDGGPAIKSEQIRIGDQLLKINGEDVSGLSFEKVMDLLKGEKEITLQLKQKGRDLSEKIVSVTLKPERITLNDDRVDVDYEQFGSGIIGRITLHSFYQNDKGITSEKDVREAIRKLDQAGNLRGLILDLRENSGGFLSQAVKVAGLFITNGVIVISKYSNGEEKIYRDMDNKDYYDGPLVVLTSRATASAAEIVAEALQDYGVAVVVGDEQTYGKGTIQSQTVTDNKGGSYFKVTVGKYYTVSGKTPQINGVKADVVVKGPYANAKIGEEYLEGTIHKEQELSPEFNDPLSDIDPNVRPWYLKYYMPTLQNRVTLWKEILPQLQKNSAHRLASNKNYQLFLKRNGDIAYAENVEGEEAPAKGNFGSADLQLSEAVNVIKDMIYLQSNARKAMSME